MKNFDIIFIAAMPPPVHGQSTVNFILHREMIEKKCSVDLFNVSPVINGGVARYHLTRFFRYLVAWLCFVNLNNKYKLAYTVYESGLGTIYNFVTFICARIRGVPVFLHHHTSEHTKFRSKKFYLLCTLLNVKISHIVLSEEMKSDLIKIYGDASVFVSTNAHCVPDILLQKSLVNIKEKNKITFGLMSNLSKEKGLHEAVNVFNLLIKNGLSVELILAGPLSEDGDRKFIESAVESSGGLIKYVGPVFGDMKINYFNSLDVFLFPSTYRYEAQPLVVLEAMAAGCPVFAMNAGYTSELLPRREWCFGSFDKYRSGILEIFKRYTNNFDFLLEDSKIARSFFCTTKADSMKKKADLIELMRLCCKTRSADR